MFTGIIEAMGRIAERFTEGENVIFWVESPLSHELKIDQSVSHDGVCLTVDALRDGAHRVTAIAETLRKTNLRTWEPGFYVNLERSLLPTSRLDGHFVQGHVDDTATCLSKTDEDGSWLYRFGYDPQFAGLLIEKGSISLNGTSLTVFDVTDDAFSVAIIPYTYAHTTIQQVEAGTVVNVEFDILGKYIRRIRGFGDSGI